MATMLAIARSSQIEEGGRLVVDAAGTTVGIFRVRGRLYAYENRCPHQGGPVCQGAILPRVKEVLNNNLGSTGYDWDKSDMHIVCPWHGYEFSIETGCHAATDSVRLLPLAVEEREGEVHVSL